MSVEDEGEATREAMVALLGALEAAASTPERLAWLDADELARLMRAAAVVASPDLAARRKLRKALRKKERNEVRRADAAVLDATGIRALRRAPIFATPPSFATPPNVATPATLPSEAPSAPLGVLRDERKCYVCKAPFREVHPFYDQMCGPCASLNWERRHQRADLTGRVALVTGARVKIGYHAAIKLLRAGARVLVTTRFPRDAAARYAREPDFEAWRDRLEVHGLDLRHTPSVEAFTRHVLEAEPRLDYLLNNACQTVRRPRGFYRHLVEAEHGESPPEARRLLARWESLRAERGASGKALTTAGGRASEAVGLLDPEGLSQLALTDDDLRDEATIFPAGALDADLQQVDLRGRNSWRLRLDEVPTVELLEVQLVNAVAPYVLNGRLRPLLAKVPTRDAHIVNVSAMEGQFYREFKTDRHPHTNMAKAALNMMTRTSAADYVRDGIHMNAVDTGWITDEDPADVAARKVEEHGFHPPLDVVDGAARIVDPIFHGVRTGEHVHGLFLKDYAPTPW